MKGGRVNGRYRIEKYFFSIQGSIIGLQSDMSDMKNDMAGMKTDIANMKTDIANMKTDIVNMKADIANMKADIINVKTDIKELQGSVKKIELKLENEIDRKISALFDAHIDELRYRKENKEIREKVASLEMRVDNLEKEVMTA